MQKSAFSFDSPQQGQRLGDMSKTFNTLSFIFFPPISLALDAYLTSIDTSPIEREALTFLTLQTS